MSLLSPMEIAEVCQEQNAAYCRCIGRPDLAEPWETLSWEERGACEQLVIKIAQDAAPYEGKQYANNVQKIMYNLTVAMVGVLSKL